MKTFQFLLQCIFSGQDESTKNFGFFTTVSVRAGSLKAASTYLPHILGNRMRSHHVRHVDAGIFRSRCRIAEIWSLPEGEIVPSNEEESGFSFFRIGPLKRPLLLARFVYEETVRKHMMINLDG